MRDVTIPARDGFPLAASVVSQSPDPRRVVLIAPATGVKRHLYRPFAEFLAGGGAAAVTWDWRGTGESRPESLRGFRASLRHWGTIDLPGVIRWSAGAYPESPLLVVGHSFGGQGVGLAGNADHLAALVTVAAQSGYWGHWPAPRKYLYALLWHLVMPPLTRALGYFPSRRFGLGEDLPRGVALQWARWCRSPDYLGTWEGHRRFRAPVLGFSFEDDPYAPRRAVEALLRRYGGDRVEHRHVAPRDAGAEAIGHFGFFREGRVPGLWDDVAAWMDEMSGSRDRAVPPSLSR